MMQRPIPCQMIMIKKKELSVSSRSVISTPIRTSQRSSFADGISLDAAAPISPKRHIYHFFFYITLSLSVRPIADSTSQLEIEPSISLRHLYGVIDLSQQCCLQDQILQK